MRRTYPKKHGRTFKYHHYTERGAKRWYKSSRYEKANSRKSTARMLVHLMTFAGDEKELELLEAKMLSTISPYTDNGWYE